MFQLIQVLYWLALSTWFGGVLFIAIAAPVIFRTIGDADPTLPRVLSVNLEGQHGTLLAGSIVANLLGTIVWIEIGCAGALAASMIAQLFFIDVGGRNLFLPLMRGALLLAGAALVIYDWRIVWPKVQKYRQEYIDHADEPDIANPAKDQFDRYHAESVGVLRNILFILLGIILFSGDIRPTRTISPDAGSSNATQAK